ncbi:hypothetical protein BJX70DRAFT_367836 [Aspergillus crustosus]
MTSIPAKPPRPDSGVSRKPSALGYSTATSLSKHSQKETAAATCTTPLSPTKTNATSPATTRPMPVTGYTKRSPHACSLNPTTITTTETAWRSPCTQTTSAVS